MYLALKLKLELYIAAGRPIKENYHYRSIIAASGMPHTVTGVHACATCSSSPLIHKRGQVGQLSSALVEVVNRSLPFQLVLSTPKA